MTVRFSSGFRLLIVLAVVVSLSLLAFALSRNAGLARLDEEMRNQLSLTRDAITTQIERYRYLPAVVAEDARILSLFTYANAPAYTANRYLQTIRSLSEVDEIYVLDALGQAIATSNHDEPGSFMGQSYAFRPYFVDAMVHGEGRYYAVGATTGIPGYFLASRIGPADAPVGVAVAKVDMSGLQTTWTDAGQGIALADAEGVVFLSGRSDWLFRPLDALNQDIIERFNVERRYVGQTIGTALRDDLRGLRLVEIPLEPDGWRVLATRSTVTVNWQANLIAVLTAVSALLLSALWVSLAQRRQLIRVKLDQNSELERCVTERTEALAHEVTERRRAQQDLREAHESLVHSAKLAALGRMSATIVHEVSQPLSALETTLAAAELHLGSENKIRTQSSLAAARALLMRMQKMVRDLRSFGARQRVDPPEPVDMAEVLGATAEVLAPRLAALGQSLDMSIPHGLPPASGRAIRLEQVATNLILNAAEAASAAGAKSPIRVSLHQTAQGLQLRIADRGSGIDPALQERIEEPFFTTRITGEGLGLGLAITRGILNQIDGSLEFHARPGGGTVTIVDLSVHANLDKKAS